MKYKVIKKTKYHKNDIDYNLLFGYKTNILKTKIKNLTIYNTKLIDKLIYNDYGIKLDKLIKKIVFFLNNEETDDNNTSSLLLDELAHQRLILKEKYEMYLSIEAHSNYLKKIRFLANELKRTRYLYEEAKIIKNPKTR